MDHFRPLYKQHRRGPAQVFDPQIAQSWGPYTTRSARRQVGCAPYAGEHSYLEISVPEIPGLRICSQMLPLEMQAELVRESTGLYLESPLHKTNFDAHMALERPLRLFEDSEMSAQQMQRKLRWVTLGGQYNWTTKQYPSFSIGSSQCPAFPSRLGEFVHAAFGIHADAAIVNYYSPGDILSPHQDVAELCKSDLVSISLGADCVFYIGMDRHDCEPLPVLLRSGDVLVMGGPSRHAFHGVGRVFEHESPLPSALDGPRDGPLADYVRHKRININIRQMFERGAV